MLKLILCSTSPARKELLNRLGLPFQTIAPHIDESSLSNETPEQMVARLAEEKARIHAQQFSNSLIIGSDQTIVLNNQMLGKPGTHENAIKQLQQMSGQKVLSLTGLCLLNTATQQCQLIVEPFIVKMRTLTEKMIENYLRKDKPYHCAGSIKAESLGICLIEYFEGQDHTALTGLPLIKLIKMLENEGVAICN